MPHSQLCCNPHHSFNHSYRRGRWYLSLDITSNIELLLQIRGQQQTVSAVAQERTYIWPSEEMLSRVVKDALRQIGEDSERALKELLTLPLK